MAISFPSNPTIGQQYTAAGITWEWNGSSWASLPPDPGISLQNLSVSSNAVGTAALSYDNSNGVFTYTPPDLSSYLTSYTETDTLASVVGRGSTTSNSISIGGIVDTGDLSVSGVSTFGDLSVSGVSTFVSDVNANGNIIGDSATNILGISSVTATTLFGDGSNITGLTTSQIAGYSGGGGTGDAEYTSEWTLGADGTNNYTFTGPGFTGAENDPEIFLVRGQKYKFTNNMGNHPFRIQSTVNGSSGSQYNDGVTNNDVSNGTLIFDVQFDAPDELYYQCIMHPNMGGKINIVPTQTVATGTRSTVSGTTGSIGAATTSNLDITAHKTYGLLKVGISSAAWVRLYVDEASRTSDATRSFLVDPTPGSGLIAEVRSVTAGVSTFLMSPGIIGYNNDVSVGSTIYTAVTNNESSSSAITVDLTVVKLEN